KFHLGDPEVNCPPRPLPFPLLPSHSGSVHGTFLASRGAYSCRGRQFANSTHSDMIDNRKPLRGPDDFFFLMSLSAPHVLRKSAALGGCPGRPCLKPPLFTTLHFSHFVISFKKKTLCLTFPLRFTTQ